MVQFAAKSAETLAKASQHLVGYVILREDELEAQMDISAGWSLPGSGRNSLDRIPGVWVL